MAENITVNGVRNYLEVQQKNGNENPLANIERLVSQKNGNKLNPNELRTRVDQEIAAAIGLAQKSPLMMQNEDGKEVPAPLNFNVLWELQKREKQLETQQQQPNPSIIAQQGNSSQSADASKLNFNAARFEKIAVAGVGNLPQQEPKPTDLYALSSGPAKPLIGAPVPVIDRGPRTV